MTLTLSGYLAGAIEVQKRRGRQYRIVLALMATTALAGLHAAASTAKGSFGVSVRVEYPACAVAVTPTMAGSAGAPVSVQCQSAVPYSIGLSDGLAAGTAESRSYSLKSSAGATARSGQRIGVELSEPPTNRFSVVGPIPVKEEVADGPSADTVTVTVVY
jgi:spore coat protein U-like protein